MAYRGAPCCLLHVRARHGRNNSRDFFTAATVVCCGGKQLFIH